MCRRDTRGTFRIQGATLVPCTRILPYTCQNPIMQACLGKNRYFLKKCWIFARSPKCSILLRFLNVGVIINSKENCSLANWGEAPAQIIGPLEKPPGTLQQADWVNINPNRATSNHIRPFLPNVGLPKHANILNYIRNTVQFTGHRSRHPPLHQFLS